MTKRVFHPDLDSYQDVDDKVVDDWAEAGWRKTPPKGRDVSGYPPVGEHPGIPSAALPVLESVAPSGTSAGTGAGSRASGTGSGSRAAGGSRTGSGSSTSTSTSGGASSGATS